MPVTSVVLFLFAVFFSLFLLGFSFSLKAKYNARHIDVYFYFMIVVVSYGFVNWIGPSFVIYFNQVGSIHSNQAIQLFIFCAIPLSFLKLYLLFSLLLSLVNHDINKRIKQLFIAIATVIILMSYYLLILDTGESGLNHSRYFISLIGVLILALNFISIFYYLTKTELIINTAAQKPAQYFGWAYLLGFAIYASPYYMSYYLSMSWYENLSPYIYYLMHGIPVYFIYQFSVFSHADFASDKTAQIADEFHLSTRELTVLKLLLTGKNNQDIADHLFISSHTVRNHVYHIYGKLDVKNRVQLMALCNN